MSKIERPVLFVDLIKEDVNYKLTKPNDPSFLKTGEKVKWLEFNENGTFKEAFDEPAVDRSLIINHHFGAMFTWQTTPVTEIVEQNDNEIVFKTKNSNYKLEKL
jgi:hypothetical protein